MLADQRATPVAVLVLCEFQRMKTMALALARWNPELLGLSEIWLPM
jgi:hypothetical protein